MKKIAATLVLVLGLHAFAAGPQVPQNVAAVLYVDLAQIKANAALPPLWDSLCSVSEDFREMESAFDEAKKDADLQRFIKESGLDKASLSWMMMTLEKLDFHMVGDSLRIPQITFAISGDFNADKVVRAAAAEADDDPADEPLEGLGVTAFVLDDKESKSILGDAKIRNVTFCYAAAAPNVVVLASNKTALQKMVSLYAGDLPADSATTRKLVATGRRGICSVAVDLKKLNLDALKSSNWWRTELDDSGRMGIEMLLNVITDIHFALSSVDGNWIRADYEIGLKDGSVELVDAALDPVRDMLKPGPGSVCRSFDLKRVGRTVKGTSVFDFVAAVKSLEDGASAETDDDK